jgi:hypothetical protein
LWLAFSLRNAAFVPDADDFCMHHVSRYCKWSGWKTDGVV